MQVMATAMVGWRFVMAQMRDWGHMTGWGWSMAIFGWVFMALVLGLVVWLVTSAIRRSEPSGGKRRSALDLLDERYARGEIDREDYLRRRADLEQ